LAAAAELSQGFNGGGGGVKLGLVLELE